MGVRQAHCSLARITLTVERAGPRLAFAQLLVGKFIVTCNDNGGDDGLVGGYCGGRGGGGVVHLSYFARSGWSRQSDLARLTFCFRSVAPLLWNAGDFRDEMDRVSRKSTFAAALGGKPCGIAA